jgi:transposase
MSHVTVGKYLTLAEKAGIAWPLPGDIDDGELERRLYQKVERSATQKPAMPPMEQLFKELKRKHVTLQLLWYEYKQDNPDGYQYSYFCELYHKWRKGLDISMRQEHLAGEKLFIDYAGQTVPLLIPKRERSRSRPRFLSPHSVPATTALLKPPHPRSCPTGSNPTSAPWSSSEACPKSWFPTT